LAVLNVVIIAFGALVIYGGASVDHASWFNEIPGADQYHINTYVTVAAWVLIVLGIVVILIGLLGLYAAWKGNGAVGCWNFLMCLVLIVILLLAVLGWASFGINQYWKSKPYPNAAEDSFSSDFNDGYCKAQGLGICYSNEALTKLAENAEVLPESVRSAITKNEGVLNDLTFQDACKLPLIKTLVPDIATLCDQCDNFEAFSGILSFANNQCPLNDATAQYCASDLLSTGSKGSSTPWEECRVPLLHSWQKYSLLVAIPATLIAIGILVIMCLACGIKKEEPEYDDFVPQQHFVTGDQNKPNPYDTNPYNADTSAPHVNHSQAVNYYNN
jgi:hypothetical protein